MKNPSEKMRKELGARTMKLPARNTVRSFANSEKIDELLSDIIEEFQGSIVFTKGAKISSRSDSYTLDVIYGLNSDINDIYFKNSIYAEQIPQTMYTFGESAEGDQFCIDGKTNEVYYWEHDAIEGQVVLIAKSFNEFIDRLVPDETIEVEAVEKSKRVISVDLDF
jgi:hypothetical protein